MATDKASFIGRHPNRVCAWLRGKNYPADGIIITGAKVQKDVPLTAEVLLLEKQGEIIRVEDEKTATDLTQVKGIARATAEKLSDLGVHTLQDLANLSGRDYDPALLASFSKDKLDAWVADAGAKAAALVDAG